MTARAEALAVLTNALARTGAGELLQVDAVETFAGATPWSLRPSCVFRLKLSDAAPSLMARQRLHEQLPSELMKLPTLIPAFPSTRERCAAADIAQLAATLLGSLMGIALSCGGAERRDRMQLGWVETFNEPATLQAINTAVSMAGCVLARVADPDPILRPLIEHLEAMTKAARPPVESRLILGAARRRDLPCLQLGTSPNMWQIGWGSRSDHFWSTSNNGNGVAAHRLAEDKDLSKQLFVELGMPTPQWRLIAPDAAPEKIAAKIGWPCVVKPLTTGAGKGVTAGIREEATLLRAVDLARNYSRFVMVEQHVPGDDHRLMVVDGKLIAAVRRIPPAIVADGKRSVAELVADFNDERKRNFRESGDLKPVPEDNLLTLSLEAQRLAPETVPEQGRTILLRSNANVSTGGTCLNVTDLIHPRVRAMAEQIAAAFRFRATGIDYLTTDIGRSPDEVGGVFIEINNFPGMDVLIGGKLDPLDLGDHMLGHAVGRIPVTLVLAPEGLHGEIADRCRPRLEPGTALVTPTMSVINGVPLSPGADDPAGRAGAILRLPSVERLIVVCSAGSVLRNGLPVDRYERVVTIGSRIPQAWAGLLARISGGIAAAGDMEEATRILFAASSRSVQEARG